MLITTLLQGVYMSAGIAAIVLSGYQFGNVPFTVIPAKAGIQLLRYGMFWMPDQVRHDDLIVFIMASK